MGIKFIGIEGFRSLRKVDWSPGALNVIIGPNASGKSNLIKVLDFMRAAVNGTLLSYLDGQGGIGSVVWDGTDRQISVDLTLEGADDEKRTSRYTLSLARLDSTANFRIASERYHGMSDTSDEPITYERTASPLTSQRLSPETARAFQGVVGKPEALLSLASSPFVTEDALRTTYQAITSWQLFEGWHAQRNAGVRQPVVSREETRLSPVGENLANVLHTHYELDEEFKERVDFAMTAALGTAYSGLVFPPGASGQIQLAIRWASLKTPQTAADLSDGTLRFLFLITALTQPNMPALIAIDEPEMGLHPSMMAIVAEYAEDAALRTQVILTTHSAEFLNGFSRDHPPTTTVAEIVDSETRLKVVDPDLLSRWLVEYTLGGLYRSLELEQMPPARGGVE